MAETVRSSLSPQAVDMREGSSQGCACKKKSRENTTEEKRRMRSSRKRRKRAHKTQVAALKNKVEEELKLRKESEKQTLLYRQMARAFWERWQWELRQRKEAMTREKAMMFRVQRRGNSSTVSVTQLHEIDPTLLQDPVHKGSEAELFIGRGSFGVVKLQVFRQMDVAVKEMLPRTVLSDVLHEARILALLCHPFVPYLFGVCTTAKPYRIVMQFHGIEKTQMSLTLYKAIKDKVLSEGYPWIGLCAQIMEALHYLHEDVGILHNDLSASNILVADSVTERASTPDLFVQIVLIDFGKATTVNDGRKYSLSDTEKAEYTRRYPHLALEVIDGITRQTKWSDMYAAGGIVQRMVENQLFEQLPPEHRSVLCAIVNKCRCPEYSRRPTAKKALESFQEIIQ